MDPVEYVVSKNIHRRQLTPKQRATAAAKALNYWAEEAKKRQQEAGKTTRSNQYKKVQVPAPVPEPAKGEARDKAGKAFGVSGRSVAAAAGSGEDTWARTEKGYGTGAGTYERRSPRQGRRSEEAAAGDVAEKRAEGI